MKMRMNGFWDGWVGFVKYIGFYQAIFKNFCNFRYKSEEMDTLTIELMSNKALPLLQELENLNIIKLIKPKKENVVDESGVIGELLELQGAMKLDKERYNDYQAFVTQARNEWD